MHVIVILTKLLSMASSDLNIRSCVSDLWATKRWMDGSFVLNSLERRTALGLLFVVCCRVGLGMACFP